MRTFPSQSSSSEFVSPRTPRSSVSSFASPIPTSSSSNASAGKGNNSKKQPDWMQKLKDKKKQEEEAKRKSYNCSDELFPSFSPQPVKSKVEYLDDDDDVAASYFASSKSLQSNSVQGLSLIHI